MTPQDPRSGFTLVELLVVIVISLIIATVTIVYSGEGRNQVALSVESAKIAELILQAKQLAIATYGTGSVPACAYGMYFDYPNQQYSLFIYSPQSVKISGYCPSLASTTANSWSWNPSTDIVQYSASTWKVPIAPGVLMASDTIKYLSADAVFFYPPNPKTIMVQTVDGIHSETNITSYVNLMTANGGDARHIAISPEGQVSF